MIDLGRSQHYYFEIKLEDGTILKIKEPTQGLFLELVALQDYADKDIEAVKRINEIMTKVFNRNINGRIFTEEEIGEMLDLKTSMMILQAYLTETGEALGKY